jgi:RNA polymerase sigma factor (sigma-70 family)
VLLLEDALEPTLEARTNHRAPAVTRLEELLAHYEAPLMAYALRFTGDLERARDVVQDAFLKLCEENAAALAGREREWLFCVCRNRAHDVRRKEARMELDGTALEGARAKPAHEPAPDARLVAEETAASLRASVLSLPEGQREVLELKFASGLSYKEIAAVTGHSISNVGVLIHRGIGALRLLHASDVREGLSS